MARPQLWVVAGPNGAGKSTLVRRHHKLAARLVVINPDDIALRIDPARRNEPIVQLQAGREALALRQDFLTKGIDFLVETTLTGKGELVLMAKARSVGFKVTLAYVGLLRAEMSAARVIERVRSGGHDVTDEDIYRRFSRSVGNLPSALKQADRAYLLDNSIRHRLLYATQGGRLMYRSANLPPWAQEALGTGL